MRALRLVGLAIGALALVGWAAWSWRGSVEDARRLRDLQRAHERLLEAQARGNQLALDLENARREIRTVEVEVVREIPKVTTVYIEKPNDPPRPIPPAVLTWGFVGLWDRALRPGVPGSAGQPAGEASGAGLARAPADTRDLLANHTVNATQYAECRAQLNALIDWHEGRLKRPSAAAPTPQ